MVAAPPVSFLVTLAIWCIPLYAVAMGLGGVMGFVKGRSRVSLASGVTSALLLGVAWFLSQQAVRLGLSMAAAIAAILAVVFALRWRKSGNVVPAGILAIASDFATALFVLGIVLSG